MCIIITITEYVYQLSNHLSLPVRMWEDLQVDAVNACVFHLVWFYTAWRLWGRLLWQTCHLPSSQTLWALESASCQVISFVSSKGFGEASSLPRHTWWTTLWDLAGTHVNTSPLKMIKSSHFILGTSWWFNH